MPHSDHKWGDWKDVVEFVGGIKLYVSRQMRKCTECGRTETRTPQ